MQRIIFIIATILIGSNLYSQDTLRFYQPETESYLLEKDIVHDFIQDQTLLEYKKQEVQEIRDSIIIFKDLLSEMNNLYVNKSEEVLLKDLQIRLKDNQISLLKDKLKNSDEAEEIISNKVTELKWRLAKKKTEILWYQIGGGTTIAVLLGILINELQR